MLPLTASTALAFIGFAFGGKPANALSAQRASISECVEVCVCVPLCLTAAGEARKLTRLIVALCSAA